ncbi:MAG TPA: AAA family ATPase [Phycisphaerales bacterium]|nr:AAA family ATPase [Phycisphaerales bacterium]
MRMAQASGSDPKRVEEFDLPAVLDRVKTAGRQVLAELRKIIVGEDEPIDQVLSAMFAGGHCMIQGPPGTAKTILIASLAKVMNLEFKRIQFTPDLMPSDISGTEILEEDTSTGHRFVKFVKGPVFCNILMADEINRTPPKTQAALLEVMQEKQVTIGGKTYPLPLPHYVLATQISLEQEGTYPLPEAQQDRFMLSVAMNYLGEDDEVQVVRQSTSLSRVELKQVIAGDELLRFQQAVRRVTLPAELGRYIVDLVAASRPTVAGCPDFVREYIAWGAGLRASQNMALAAKSAAAQDGRDTVTADDIRKAIVPVLRHRIGLSFRAEVDRVTVEDVIRKLVESVSEPAVA